MLFGDRWDPSEVMEKTDCWELLEVHRNVIDVKSIAFLMILLAPEDSFVNLHIRWHKGCCSNSIHKNERFLILGKSMDDNLTWKLFFPRLLLYIGFIKAFDTMEWTFVQKTLEHFGFRMSLFILLWYPKLHNK